MIQTIKEIEVNVAYRWYLGFGFYDKVPHFSKLGKNYERQFKGTNIFEEIFLKILLEIENKNLIDSKNIFIDGTPHKG